MTRTTPLATAALAATLLAGGLTAASAQTLTVVSSSVTGAAPAFVYTYTLSSSIPINQLSFNFSDPNPFTSITTTGPLTLTSSVVSAGLYNFTNATTALAANTPDTFVFTSTDAPGSTVGAFGISYAGSGVTATNGITPAPAPEASQTAALGLGVLGIAGLVLKARRRKSVA